MDATLRDQLAEKLKEKEARLTKELTEVTSGDTAAAFPDYGDHEDENSAEVATYTTNLSVEQTLQKALRDVQNALKRIDEEGFGICKYCKQPIDERRLLARPSSSACVSCKEEMKSRA